MSQHVLIVEDDEVLREMYATKFQLEGFDVTTAADGEAGLAAALASEQDLIILDNLMPYLSGLQLLERFRTERPLSHALILFLSNKSAPEDITLAKQLGANEYLIKSQFTPRDLIIKVRERLKSLDGPTQIA